MYFPTKKAAAANAFLSESVGCGPGRTWHSNHSCWPRLFSLQHIVTCRLLERRVATGGLDAAQVGAVYSRFFGQAFLRPSLRGSQSPNSDGQIPDDLVFGLQAPSSGHVYYWSTEYE